MNNSTNLSIELDINKFKKIAKKLQSKIYDKTQHNIKLSIIQESLSESMGFRNLNDFKSQSTPIALKKESKSINRNFLFFDVSIKDNRKIIRTLHRNIPNEERYNIPSSSVMLLEILIANHNYFDSCDFCLDKVKSLNFLTEIYEQKTVDNTNVFKEYFEYALRFNKSHIDCQIYDFLYNDIENIYHKRHYEAYDGLINFLSIIDMIKNNNIVVCRKSWFSNSNINSRYGAVIYKDDIYKSPFYYKSWLHMESYYNLVSNLDYLSPSSSFKMSDLLLHATNIISPSLKENMSQLISIIIDNYEDCIEISKNFKDL